MSLRMRRPSPYAAPSRQSVGQASPAVLRVETQRDEPVVSDRMLKLLFAGGAAALTAGAAAAAYQYSGIGQTPAAFEPPPDDGFRREGMAAILARNRMRRDLARTSDLDARLAVKVAERRA